VRSVIRALETLPPNEDGTQSPLNVIDGEPRTDHPPSEAIRRPSGRARAVINTDFPPAEAPSIILVIDDQPVLRASLVRGLGKLQGVEVVDGGSVREARELIQAFTPSLIVCDLNLPDGSGVEVLAELDRCGKRAPIIFVSTGMCSNDAALPQRPDVEVHEKPISMSRLRAIVQERIGGPAIQTSPFSVADYIQLASMGRRSARLQIRQGGTLRGEITINAGEVWSASDARGAGIEAFRRLVFAREALVSCHPLGELGPRTIDGSAEEALLDAARMLDEGRMEGEVDRSSFDDTVRGREREPDRERDRETVRPASIVTPVVTSDDAERQRACERETVRPTAVPPMPTFDDCYDDAVAAALAHDYTAAYRGFRAASELRPDDTRVVANLKRLKEMGFGKD
jgi:CheY-like chemotaxis protein